MKRSFGREYRDRTKLVVAVLLSILLVSGCAAPEPSLPQTATPEHTTGGGGLAQTPSPEPTPSGPSHLSSDPDSVGQPVARAVRGGPPVRTAPDKSSPVLSGLYFDTALPLLEERAGADGSLWYRTRLWGVIDGWIEAAHISLGTAEAVKPFYEGAEPTRAPTRTATPSLELLTTGIANHEVVVRDGPGLSYEMLSTLPKGESVLVRAWATDGEGHAWYKAQTRNGEGWLYSALVDLEMADPVRPLSDGKPLAAIVSGKGIWLPQPLIEMADERQIVEAAKRLGLSHIFLEAGETTGGFYSRKEAARLLPAAHEAGIAVVAWLTTGLYNLARDVELCAEIAAYRTADGHSFDGIAPDIEQNMHGDDVKAFAEITRARLGDDKLIVGVVYPAGGWFGREYPIYSRLARAFNVLAPMAYWSDKQRAYSYGEAYAYTIKAVIDMKAAAGPGYPVHLVGQMYDTFGRNGTGAYSPGREEIRAALQAGLDAGAVGVSFFQWGTATPEEWAALRDFPW